jgi:hypothetical protein
LGSNRYVVSGQFLGDLFVENVFDGKDDDGLAEKPDRQGDKLRSWLAAYRICPHPPVLRRTITHGRQAAHSTTAEPLDAQKKKKRVSSGLVR